MTATVVTAWNQWRRDPQLDDALLVRERSPWHASMNAIRAHPGLFDACIAVAVALCTVPQLLFWANQPSGLGERALLTALLILPLCWRQRFPLSTFTIAAFIALIQWAVNITLTADIALLIYLYTVANRYRLRVSVVALGAMGTGVFLAAFSWDLAADASQPLPVRLISLASPVAASFLLGVSVRSRRLSLAVLTDRAQRLERERDQQATIAAAAERARISQEMHDVVAHNLSVMVTLSEAATVAMADDPTRARKVMSQVSATGRQALTEMRGLLGVLADDHDGAGRHPQPGIADLDQLIERARLTGPAVTFTQSGDITTVPANTQLAIYRIVQEAITNVLKHAPDASWITVNIDITAHRATVTIDNNGYHQATDSRITSSTPGNGRGINGMQERTHVLGGSLTAGTQGNHRWRVYAEFPMTGKDRVHNQ